MDIDYVKAVITDWDESLRDYESREEFDALVWCADKLDELNWVLGNIDVWEEV